MKTKHKDVQEFHCYIITHQVPLRGFVLLLFLYKYILCCPSACQVCTGRQVNCRDTGLTSVPKNLPETATLLYLNGNNITHINHSEFLALKKLAVLYLDKSNIYFIHPGAFASLKKLYYLYLNDNSIEHLYPRVFEGLSYLYILHLQNNLIGFLHQGVFDQLKSVRYLSLQRNHLRTLGNDTFCGLVSLRTLNLSNNNISQISEFAFRHLEGLENLYLEGNNLMQVPSESLGLLKHLKRLSLSNNPLTALHSLAFNGLESLQILFIVNSNIQLVYEESFYGLSNLKQLILSGNELDSLNSTTFAHLNHLLYLQLDRNHIRSISDSTFEEMGASLKALNLAFNNLTFLQQKVLQPLVSLSHFQANYNPWDCGCDFLEIRNFLLSSSFTYSIHCHNPSRLRGRPMSHIKQFEFEECLTKNTLPQAKQLVAFVTSTSKFNHMKSVTSVTWSDTSSRSADDILYPTVSIFGAPTSQDSSKNTTEHMLLRVDIPGERAPVNLTRNAGSHLSPSIITVSLKPLVICEQKVESVNQSFNILLSFFVLSCAIIGLLIFKIIQLKRKILAPENTADSALEYYSCYQSGRFSVNDPTRVLPPHPIHGTEIDLIRPLKHPTAENQTQVILFEHSVL